MIHVSGFIALKHICGAQTPFFENFPLNLVSFISVWNWNVIWFFFQIMRCTLDNDQYSLVVSHEWNVDI